MEFKGKPRKIVLGVALALSIAAMAVTLVGWGHSAMLWVSGEFSMVRLSVLRFKWDLVAASIALFLAFLALLPVRLKAAWRPHGVYTAFIVSLFAEMFGFPLTIYFASSYLNLTIFEREFMTYMYKFGMLTGSVVTVVGIILIVLGWKEVYRGKGGLVTSGVYRYVRHPQYLGLILVTFGWLIHWPTIPGAVMWPLLTYMYYRLSKHEEKALLETFGEDYQEYASNTPMLLPVRR